MKCPSCNKVIKKTDLVCKFCGVDIESNKEKVIIEEHYIYKTVESKANKWLILIIGLLSFIVVLETSYNIWFYFVKEPAENDVYLIKNYDYNMHIPFDIKKTNEEFSFDDLTINISNKYQIIKLDNIYSPHNGKNVLKIPITIKNASDKNHSLNLFYYDIYDDYGNLIDEVAGYFDESLYYAEDLKPNESYTKYIYALYYGNNYYTIKIGNKDKIIYIKYNVKNNLTK